ncbi:hypothetical protein ES332_A03G031900v1 [Gossypium tomentosum]|uniref:Uncharacterized protein n=1 Tax=Gossypium tomentosum TaxID=34277 RepID=A0A5D2R4X8_GOSTO|nr:hypothetical protein ES332_A03G031900v1 [Gossypium tomentosum]
MQNQEGKKINNKNDDGPVRISSLRHVGLERIKPVILPLLREGGLRCSVKPASRSTLHSRNHEAQSFHSSPSVQLLAWNGQSQIWTNSRSDSASQPHVPSP